MQTATGHLVGAKYFSGEHGMTYVVESAATIWELAPGDAVSVAWENGRRCALSGPCRDRLVASPEL